MGKITLKEPSEKFDLMRGETRASGHPTHVRGSGSVEILSVSVEKITQYEKQARKRFSEEEIKSLAKSIDEVGLINPIQLIKLPEQGTFSVVNGERRLRAAKLLGMKKINCVILDSSDEIELISIVDNLQRQDLHPIELAGAFSSLLEGFGDKKRVAEKLGISYTSFLETVQLSKIPLPIQKILLDKNIRSRTIHRKIMRASSTDDMFKIVDSTLSSSSYSVVKKKTKIMEFTSLDGKVQVKIGYKRPNNDQIDRMIEILRSMREE